MAGFEVIIYGRFWVITEARLARSSILNKLNSFSGIDFTLAFR